MIPPRRFCLRHTWSVVSTTTKEKLTPYGARSGRYGDWQVVRCVHCQHEKQRWAPSSRGDK